MMDKLMEEVKELVEREYGRASAHYGPTHHSDHEAYAVTLEEVQEALHEANRCECALQRFWDLIKQDWKLDNDKLTSLKLVETTAILAACEFIQVAAMAKKSAITICDRGAVDEFKGE